MSFQIDFRPEAEQDLLDAFAWYQARQVGLGDIFVDHIDVALEEMKQHPLAFPKVHFDIRRHAVRRFPYGIFYIVEESRIVVLAIYHGRRSPHGWKNRR